MSKIQERGSTHVYKVNKISKEDMDAMVPLCVYEHPPFCNAACPLKLDTRALLQAAAAGTNGFVRSFQTPDSPGSPAVSGDFRYGGEPGPAPVEDAYGPVLLPAFWGKQGQLQLLHGVEVIVTV